MTENEIAHEVVDAAYQIHATLDPGLLESVYEVILAAELEQRGLKVARQQRVPVRWGRLTFDEGFRADLIVDGKVVIELKSIEELSPVHKKQVLTYLRLTGARLGLLVNFGASLIKQGIVRVVNGLPEAGPPQSV